jgi:hypothetical protein
LYKEIVQKQKQLQMLRDEQDALASEDRTKVSQVLMSRMDEDRAVLDKQLEDLANNQPEETAQKLRDERIKLQADIDENRDAYYYTISPQVMLNLVRLQSFAKRIQRKVEKAKTTAESQADTFASGLLHAVLAIVVAFEDTFDKLCLKFVCHPPQNEANKISYAQYYARYHDQLGLTEAEKKSIIQGNADMDLIKKIFPEHAQPDVPTAVSAPSLSLRK